MKIEYGRAWNWFLSLIFREKKVKKVDAYQSLVDITKEYYAPAVQEQFEKQWQGSPDPTRYVNHQIPPQPMRRIEKAEEDIVFKRDYIDEEIKKELGIPYNTKHGIHRPKLGIEMPKAHAKIKAGYKEEKHDKDS